MIRFFILFPCITSIFKKNNVNGNYYFLILGISIAGFLVLNCITLKLYNSERIIYSTNNM